MKLSKCACVAAIVFLPFAANADPREDLVDGVAKCAVIADNTARLACFDALTPQLKAAQAAPATPAVAPPAQPADNRAWYDPARTLRRQPIGANHPRTIWR